MSRIARRYAWLCPLLVLLFNCRSTFDKNKGLPNTRTNANTGLVAACELTESRKPQFVKARMRSRERGTSRQLGRSKLKRTCKPCAWLLQLLLIIYTYNLNKSVRRDLHASQRQKTNCKIILFTSSAFHDVKSAEDWNSIYQGKVEVRVLTDPNERHNAPGTGVHSGNKTYLGRPARWSWILDSISKESKPNIIVGYFNPDIYPSQQTAKVLKFLTDLDIPDIAVRRAKPFQKFERTREISRGWLAVASRFDWNATLNTVRPHRQGGIDFWLWNYVEEDNTILGGSFELPDFRVGRPYYDMWFLSMAIQRAHRHIIDITIPAHVIHKDHPRQFKDWSRSSKGIYNDVIWNENYRLAHKRWCVTSKQCYNYVRRTGTVCETPAWVTASFRLAYRRFSTPYNCLQ